MYAYTIKTRRNYGRGFVAGLATIGWALLAAVLFMASGQSAGLWLQRVLLGTGN